MAKNWPHTAARVVLTPGVNVRNAWDVLADAWGEDDALHWVECEARKLADGRDRVGAILREVAPHLIVKSLLLSVPPA
jgi:hypothetical protein